MLIEKKRQLRKICIICVLLANIAQFFFQKNGILENFFNFFRILHPIFCFFPTFESFVFFQEKLTFFTKTIFVSFEETLLFHSHSTASIL